MTLSYIEGWHAIAEANRIFGYDAWDRQTMTMKCVWEGLWRNRNACSYIARVRVRVRAGDAEICREGCGAGHGTGTTPGEAHESAIKEAETDAMKRALTTFGNPFGLALYDKEQQNVRGRRQKGQNGANSTNAQPITWIVLSGEGEYLSAHEDPIDCCKALRQLLEAASTPERLRALWQRNLVTLAMLKRNLPALKTDSDQHYADILTSLYKKRLREMHEEKTAGRQGGGEPCLICGRSPGHAHHLRFAQPRALGRKVSDEWVVPLCATHHRALHGVGDEERWWKERGIDPIGHAQILWWTTRFGKAPQASENPAGMNKDREKEFASMPQ